MSFILRVSHIVICLALATLLMSCGAGGSSKGSKTNLSIIPPKPIVITGPTKDTLGNDVPGAWYRFSVTIDNPTDEELTIVALQVETTTVDEGGVQTTTETTFSPTQFNFQLSDTVECKFTSFGTIPANSSAALALDDDDAGCDATAIFIVGNNSTGPNGNNFRFKVRVKPLGWFGPEALTSTTASFDRYEKTATFFTR